MSLPENRAVPRLSIGMPVYNGARFLPAALDSLLGQTFSDFELIVSDNASTDETPEIIADYARRDSRIAFHRQEINRGAAFNFNYVVHQSRGEYFKWAAADDICAPTFAERCIEVLDRDPEIVCCHARTRKIDEKGQVLEHLDDPTDGGLPTAWFLSETKPRHHRPDASLPRPSRRFADILLFSGWAARSYSIFRMSALRQTSLLLPYYGSEKTTMVELALQGRFYDVPETLFYQRVHAAASSRLKTSAGQQQYIAGNSNQRRSPHAMLMRDYLRALSAARLPLAERICCYGWIVRYLLQFHKWPGIISAALRGNGVGSAQKELPLNQSTTAAAAP